MKLSHLGAVMCASFLLGSCGNNAARLAEKRAADSLQAIQDRADLDQVMAKLDEPMQVFTAPGDQVSIVRGKKGTTIFVSPTDLETEDGKPASGNIVVELKELTDQRALAGSGAQTVSDGRILQSGGAYYINMSSGGSKLKLREGKDLKVAFPRITDSAMSIFYGQRDAQGQMNWLPTEQQLTTSNGYAVETADTTSEGSIMVYNSRNYSLMGYVGTDSSFRRDTSLLNAMKKRVRDSIDKARMEAAFRRRYADSVRRERYRPITEASQKLSESLYDIVSLRQLGWVNCDKFTSGSTTIRYTINPADSILVADVFLIFKGYNSVVKEIFINNTSSGTRTIDRVPIAMQVRLVAVAHRKGQLLASKMDMTIVEGQHTGIDWKPVSPQELDSYFRVNENWGQ
ncbi:MAG: hypothetical protein KF744_12910 [Taibaiella sp.]|nr:hypothetical protein [Taibaiella sp.]